MEAQGKVCDEILAIMRVYHEQEAEPGGVSTPGGLEHMGDVWRLFMKWEKLLEAPAPAEAEPTYPCRECGLLRTKAEGGKTFTVCDACWEKSNPAPAEAR